MTLTSKQKGTKRFIRGRGDKVTVEATFVTKEEAKTGDTVLKLYEPLGLLPGTKFTLPIADDIVATEQTLTVQATYPGEIHLEQPLLADIPANTLLQLPSSIYALFTSPGRDITRDTIESNRRVRVPIDTVITYGSVLQFGTNRYYVSGYQEGDSSLSIGLKVINTKIDIYTLDPKYQEPVEEAGEEDVTGWMNPKAEVEKDVTKATRDWPNPMDLVLLHGQVEAYQEQQSLYGDLEEPGQIPSLNRFYLIPIWIPVEVGDYIKTDEAVMRILGKDFTRVRNMQALFVNYYRGADVGEEEV